MPADRCFRAETLPESRCSWENALPADVTEASGAASPASIVFTCLT